MQAYFERFTLNITKVQALAASRRGDVTAEAHVVAATKSVSRQLDKIKPSDIAAELRECGAWDEQELADHSANRVRIVWIACGNIREALASK